MLRGIDHAQPVRRVGGAEYAGQRGIVVGLDEEAVLGLVGIARAARQLDRVGQRQRDLSEHGEGLAVGVAGLGRADIFEARRGRAVPYVAQDDILLEVTLGVLVQSADHHVDRTVQLRQQAQFLRPGVPAGIFGGPVRCTRRLEVAGAGPFVVGPLVVGDRGDLQLVRLVHDVQRARRRFVAVEQAAVVLGDGEVLGNLGRDVVLVVDEVPLARLAGQLRQPAVQPAAIGDIVPRVVVRGVDVVIAFQRHGQPVGRLELERGAAEEFLFARLFARRRLGSEGLRVPVAARGQVGEIDGGITEGFGQVGVIAALHVGIAACQADAETVGQRVGGDRLDLVLLGLEFISAAHDELGLAARVLGGDGNHARSRVLAEEQRLRALQHLDPAKVEEALVDDAALSVIGAVDDHRDRLLDADGGR